MSIPGMKEFGTYCQVGGLSVLAGVGGPHGRHLSDICQSGTAGHCHRRQSALIAAFAARLRHLWRVCGVERRRMVFRGGSGYGIGELNRPSSIPALRLSGYMLYLQYYLPTYTYTGVGSGVN